MFVKELSDKKYLWQIFISSAVFRLQKYLNFIKYLNDEIKSLERLIFNYVYWKLKG